MRMAQVHVARGADGPDDLVGRDALVHRRRDLVAPDPHGLMLCEQARNLSVRSGGEEGRAIVGSDVAPEEDRGQDLVP
jgi:hypothetical protein